MFEYINDKNFGTILIYNKGVYGNYYSIHGISYENKINYIELENIIEDFNGVEICSSVVCGEIIQFKNEEDCKKCIEYLDSLLILNKLIGD